MNITELNQSLRIALQQPWTAIYTKIIAIALFYGATVHLGNMLGWTGTPWLSTPLLWRGMDILLLIFNLVTAIALWQGLVWSIWLLFIGMIGLQTIPYTIWRSHFILQPEDGNVLNGLLSTEILGLIGLIILLWL